MILLLIKNSKTNYSLLSPDTYGMATWGTNSQDSLEKKRKHWYTTHWIEGNQWEDDYIEEYKLNVVLETTNIEEIVIYLFERKAKCINDILDSFKKIVDDYISFMKWTMKEE